MTRKLVEWRDSPDRKPLLVRGARQVGKTYSVLDFGRTAFEGHAHHVDLELRRDAHAAFADDISPIVVLRRLPAVVRSFVDSGAMFESFALQDAIVATYRDDFGKYGVRVDRDCLDEVLRSTARRSPKPLRLPPCRRPAFGRVVRQDLIDAECPEERRRLAAMDDADAHSVRRGLELEVVSLKRHKTLWQDRSGGGHTQVTARSTRACPAANGRRARLRDGCRAACSRARSCGGTG